MISVGNKRRIDGLVASDIIKTKYGAKIEKRSKHRIAIVVSEGADQNVIQQSLPRHKDFIVAHLDQIVTSLRAITIRSRISQTRGVWTEADNFFRDELVKERLSYLNKYDANMCVLVNHPQEAQMLGLEVRAFVVPHAILQEERRLGFFDPNKRADMINNYQDMLKFRTTLYPMPHKFNGKSAVYYECETTLHWQAMVRTIIDEYISEKKLTPLETHQNISTVKLKNKINNFQRRASH